MRKLSSAAHGRQLSDAQRESAIQLSHRQLTLARDKRTKFAAWRIMVRLIKSRTPEQIARLERERGLVKPS